MSKHKLDIFQTLSALDRKDHEWLSKRTDEERKAFAAPVVLRWMSAVSDRDWNDYHLMMINERVNRGFFDLSDHPDLQFRLLASCGGGVSQRHQWVPSPPRSAKDGKLVAYLKQQWPDANGDEIAIVLRSFTRETFEQYVKSTGCDDKELKERMNAYEGHFGIKKEKPGSSKA